MVNRKKQKTTRKKKKTQEIKPVKPCSAIVRVASEIHLEIIALVSESLQRHQHHPLLTANIATVAMLPRDGNTNTGVRREVCGVGAAEWNQGHLYRFN